MTTYSGSCLCAKVTFEVTGEFDRFYLCHCQHCQKDTGAGNAANLFSGSAQLSWQSGADAVASYTHARTRHSNSFCKVCGSALPNTHIEGLLVVPAGALDNRPDLSPTAHVFTSSSAGWEDALAELPAFKPGPGALLSGL